MNALKTMFALVIAFATLHAVADPYQTASEPHPYLCKSPETAYDAWKKKRPSLSGAIGMLESGECKEVPRETKFRVLESVRKSDIMYSRVEIIGEDQPPAPLYIGGILNPPIDPEEQARQRELAKLPIGCELPTGGEIRRLERGKDGQVYIKRFMITTKCVNGQMRSFTTPID